MGEKYHKFPINTDNKSKENYDSFGLPLHFISYLPGLCLLSCRNLCVYVNIC